MPSDIHAHAHGHSTISHLGAAAKPMAQNQQMNPAMAVGANTATAANSKGAEVSGNNNKPPATTNFDSAEDDAKTMSYDEKRQLSLDIEKLTGTDNVAHIHTHDICHEAVQLYCFTSLHHTYVVFVHVQSTNWCKSLVSYKSANRRCVNSMSKHSNQRHCANWGST